MASNRDSPSEKGDTIALFEVSPDGGVERTEQGWIHGLGKHLRGVAGDKSGKWVVVGARDGGGVTVLERGGEDGLELKEVARLEGVEKVVAPIWVL